MFQSRVPFSYNHKDLLVKIFKKYSHKCMYLGRKANIWRNHCQLRTHQGSLVTHRLELVNPTSQKWFSDNLKGGFHFPAAPGVGAGPPIAWPEWVRSLIWLVRYYPTFAIESNICVCVVMVLRLTQCVMCNVYALVPCFPTFAIESIICVCVVCGVCKHASVGNVYALVRYFPPFAIEAHICVCKHVSLGVP